MTDDLKLLPPPQAKVACSVLDRLGFSYGQIEKITGVKRVTAWRYAKAPIPEDMKHFESELNDMFSDMETIVAAKALARLDEKMAIAKISEALEVYKIMRNKQDAKVGIQVNTMISDMKNKYNI
jgi:hypothetical protein